MRIRACDGLAGLAASRWLAALEAGEALPPAPEPERPEGVEAASWRRAGPVARLALGVGFPLLPSGSTTILWATGLGELEATGRFLGRLAEEGPLSLSAAAFQASLPGTAGALLAIAAAARPGGVPGAVETFAGAGASGAALLRASLLLELRRVEAVLIVGAHAPHPVVEAAGGVPAGGIAAALLLGRDGAGPGVSFGDEVAALRLGTLGDTGLEALLGVVALAAAGRAGVVADGLRGGGSWRVHAGDREGSWIDPPSGHLLG